MPGRRRGGEVGGRVSERRESFDGANFVDGEEAGGQGEGVGFVPARCVGAEERVQVEAGVHATRQEVAEGGFDRAKVLHEREAGEREPFLGDVGVCLGAAVDADQHECGRDAEDSGDVDSGEVLCFEPQDVGRLQEKRFIFEAAAEDFHAGRVIDVDSVAVGVEAVPDVAVLGRLRAGECLVG